MKKIGLLACCKRKSGKDNPAQKFKAQDIYTGNTFKKSKTVGLSRFGCEDWHILSAKYGLLCIYVGIAAKESVRARLACEQN